MTYQSVSRKGSNGLDSDASDNEPEKGGGLLQNPNLVCWLASCCSVCCSCCYLALTVGGILLIVRVGGSAAVAAGATMIAAVVLFLLIVLCCYAMLTFELDGNHYNCCNYYFPLAQQFIMAFKGDSNAWYKSLTKEDPYVGHGPGPNTLSYYGRDDCVRLFKDWNPRIENGTMKRHGELGLTVFHSGPFSEMGVISTCLPNDDHAVGRPYIGRVLDAARLPENSQCDGSQGWNNAYLRSFFAARFAEIDYFRTSELQTWTARLLHKIHMNLDVTDDEANTFGKLRTKNATYSAFPPRTTCCPFFGAISGMNKFNQTREDVVDGFKDAIEAKFPSDSWDSDKLAIVANMFCDSILFAGGLSVPNVIQTMLSLWFTKKNRHAALDEIDRHPMSEPNLRNFMLEAVRRYAPVAGVPRWITDDDGETWDHEVCNLRMANRDPRVFPDPMNFILGRPGNNHTDESLSCAWAEPLMVGNDVQHPNSHSCPGKQLSQEIIIAFFVELFKSGPWDVDEDAKGGDAEKIQVTDVKPSVFQLTKRGADSS